MSNSSHQTVHAYLVETASAEPTSLRAREIANELDASSNAVAQYLGQLQDGLVDVSLEQWSRSKSTTWRLSVSES